MNLKAIKTSTPLALRPEQTVKEVTKLLIKNKVDSASVFSQKGEFLGNVSRSDIFCYVSEDKDINNEIQVLLDFKKYNEGKFQQVRGSDYSQDPEEDAGDMLPYDSIFDSIHNLVIAVDKMGTIKLYNKSAERLLGMKSSEAIGKNILEIIPNSRLMNVIESGEAETLQKIQVGEHNYAISNRTPILKDGQIIGAVGVFQDITEIERASKELRYVKKLNEDLDAIIQSSYDGLFITDGNGIILRYNKAFEQLTGINAHEYLGRSVHDIKKDGIMSELVSLQVIEKRKPVTIIQESRNGKSTLTTGNPVFGENGKIKRIVINVRDITELKNLQLELQKVNSLNQHYENQIRSLRLRYNGSGKLVITSAVMNNLLDMVIRLAAVDSTILITGESGTGKELIAETIHNNSTRKDKPLIKVNCGAIPESLLESELFGYNAGAFTGAVKEGKPGYVELAAGGTLFLDEIGEVPLNLQVKLLRLLQNKEIIRVGGRSPSKVDVRIIAATNRNLLDMVQARVFREDLYYRLNVVPVCIPPLRERKEDIPALVAYFIQFYNQKYNISKSISQEVISALMEYNWPGNVRELENLIERLLVITPQNIITLKDIPSNIVSSPRGNSFVSVSGIMPLRDAIESVEKQLLEKVYAKNITTRQMAEELKVDASTIVRKASKYKIVTSNKYLED